MSLTIVALVMAAAYIGVLTTLYALQDVFVFQPVGATPAVASAGLAELQAIELRTADGLDLAAWYLPPQPGQPTVLYLHGNGGNLGDRAGRGRRIAARG